MAETAGGDALATAYLLLKADDSALPSGLARVRDMVMGSVQSIGAAASKTLGGAFSIGGLLGANLASSGLMVLFAQMKSALGGFVSKAAEAEQGQVRFRTALAASGGAAGFTGDQLEEMNKALQANSTFTEEAVRQAQTLLFAFNSIRGDQFKATVTVAADLASFLGGDLPSAARMLAMALEQPEHGLMRLRRVGIVLTDSEK
jgi:hypothetical protein